MGKMIHATVHENEYQVTIQAVFRKPESLSQSAFYIDETVGQYAMNSERSSTFSSTFNSDGKCLQNILYSSDKLLFIIQMNILEKSLNQQNLNDVRKNVLNQLVLLVLKV